MHRSFYSNHSCPWTSSIIYESKRTPILCTSLKWECTIPSKSNEETLLIWWTKLPQSLSLIQIEPKSVAPYPILHNLQTRGQYVKSFTCEAWGWDLKLGIMRTLIIPNSVLNNLTEQFPVRKLDWGKTSSSKAPYKWRAVEMISPSLQHWLKSASEERGKLL